MSASDIVFLYATCLIFSVAGVYVANLHKRLGKDAIWITGVGVVLSLGAFLLDILFVRFFSDVSIIDEVAIAAVYAYFMADADIFLRL